MVGKALGHRTVILPVKRIALVLCPLILLVVLKETVELVRFSSFVSDIGETTTPFQKQIALSNGAQLLAEGETRCGGITGDCVTSARVRIRWRNKTMETVGEKIVFGESGIGPVRLSSFKGRWQLIMGDQTWTRIAKNAWSSGSVDVAQTQTN